ncbi:redoxin family protein [bacterium]|nr:redoxin family protein [bacterium]MBU1995108.1 redoxin family protein [bacterium]
MKITVHGTTTQLIGKEVSVGKEAPAARITKLDKTKNVIGMIAPNTQLIIAIPSLKTEVCSLGAKKFNDLVKQFKKLTTIMVTTDDIEFVKEYKNKECIDSAELVIDEERNFGKKFGLLISEGKLKDRLARAVFVIDKEGLVAYKELVSEIVDEVNYDACIEAIQMIVREKKKGHTHENWMSV